MTPGTTGSEMDVGVLLREKGQITEKHLQLAEKRRQRLKIPLHQAIVDLNYATEEDTYRALAHLNNLEFVDSSVLNVAPENLKSVPIKLIFHYRFIPIQEESGQITVAFAEPPLASEQGNLRLLLGKRLRIVLTTPSCIHAVLKDHFGLGAETIQKIREDHSLDDISEELVFDVGASEAGANVDASISKFVNQILVEALRLDATDIHIEPYLDSIRLRYRIDGVLQAIPVPEGLRNLYAAISSRLKIMAGLDISEKRIPHDGRIAMKTGQQDYDLRISTLPTNFGEGICLRILGRQNLLLDLGNLGLEPEQEQTLSEMTRLPGGLILITGPTGSGKTTTLYAALTHANDEGRKIITIEDPVEYQMEGASQIQIHPEIGLTFSTGLRSILRHDPDVILIGEIRDQETAEIAIRAAQTGHLVFSTLHTNDSVSTLIRLIDMGVEPFLAASSLVGSIAQRLAQRICRSCGQPDPDIPDSIRKEMSENLGIDPDQVQAFRGTGCIECGERGYRGRVAIYEFFLINDAIADELTPDIKASELRSLAKRYGWQTLREAGWRKVQAGLVSIEELERLTRRITFHQPVNPSR